MKKSPLSCRTAQSIEQFSILGASQRCLITSSSRRPPAVIGDNCGECQLSSFPTLQCERFLAAFGATASVRTMSSYVTADR